MFFGSQKPVCPKPKNLTSDIIKVNHIDTIEHIGSVEVDFVLLASDFGLHASNFQLQPCRNKTNLYI